SRRDVPVPSLLARRPCLASPCATPPLGLLTGNGVRVAWKIVDVALALLFFVRTNRRHQPPLSGGRVESLCRGASGMDAARGVKGHGWPLYAGPRSSDGVREPRHSRGRMEGQDLLVSFGATAKRNSPSRAKPTRSANSDKPEKAPPFSLCRAQLTPNSDPPPPQ